MVQDYLAALEASGFGDAVRSALWLYPMANLAHVLGAALLVGSIAVFDLLVLRRRYPEAAAAGSMAVPLAATGLALLVVSGTVLFTAEATIMAGNPAFLFKMALLALGLANIAGFHVFHRDAAVVVEGHSSMIRLHATISLGVWIFVLLASCAITYV